jgi:hypothetical protein
MDAQLANVLLVGDDPGLSDNRAHALALNVAGHDAAGKPSAPELAVYRVPPSTSRRSRASRSGARRYRG